MILKDGAREAVGSIFAFYLERLDTKERLIETAPRDIILGGRPNKYDTAFLHVGAFRIERANIRMTDFGE